MAKTFAHEEAFRGEDLAERLKGKLVTVCGAGTLGSILIDTLARQEFTSLRAIDMDRVEQHNVNTQIYGLDENGKMKVAALMARVYRDTRVRIDTVNKELTQSNVKKNLKGSDLVIDVFDNRASRLIVRNHCRQNNIPCLHGGMFEGYGEVVWDKEYTVPADPPIDAQDVCDYPLARNLATAVVSIIAEETMNFALDEKERRSWSFTLGDLAIRRYR